MNTFNRLALYGVSGIKRHIAVETNGLPHAMAITTAKVVQLQGHAQAVRRVKRSFAWLKKNRRLWKNRERKLATSLQFVHLAFLTLLLRRS